MVIDLRLVSPLEKVFTDEAPRGGYCRASGFANECVSFQASWIANEYSGRDYAVLKVESDIPVRVRRVTHVPVKFPLLPDADSDYLRRTPGLYPDALTEIEDGSARIYSWKWETVWIDIENAPAGDHDVKVAIASADGQCRAQKVFSAHIINAELPEQALIHTKWFHCDGICQYYNVKMWSERFWSICEAFIAAAARRGINMLLTPIHTPPLDTAVGRERMTCQLVDIEKNGDRYEFGFDRFDRWVEMALKNGIKYFELAHLFTQWGARHAPKIIAKVGCSERRIFGWETDATGEEYENFLAQYVPAIINECVKLGIADRIYFHISDEPSLSMLEDYRAAHDMAEKYIGGYPIIDALSSYEFYTEGAIKTPIPSINHIQPFVDGGVKDLWTYYCIGQYKLVTNMFMAMPSQRNRILGVMLYKYGIVGFLQWGYNFYNSQGSYHPVDPWLDTDGDGFSPAGDTFQVYPGADGKPVESIRMMVTDEAMYDMRAFRLLESLTDKEFVMSVIEEGIEPVTFTEYPRDADYLPRMRERINAEIEKRLAK